ncbi:MAG TPA: hypothetical protein VE913_13565 [Longimicrobium sp.]|nr:hypothetical protein [Longimicrobium sp.]
MRKFIVAICLASIFLFATNPGPAQHRDRFREQFQEAHPVASFFGADRLGSAILAYHSYGLFSITSVGGAVTTLGVAGFVITSPEL